MKANRQAQDSCKFCSIVRKETGTQIVFEDNVAMAFLDHRPLFPGHCLLVPKSHYETLMDVPPGEVGKLFHDTQIVTRAVEKALAAEGSFVAINNRVSQSVPHLHVHIVPRCKGDGLKGFFWPRHPYKNASEMEAVAKAIRSVIPVTRK